MPPERLAMSVQLRTGDTYSINTGKVTRATPLPRSARPVGTLRNNDLNALRTAFPRTR